MNFEMYQDAILTVDLPEQGLCTDDIGTVVDRHVVPDKDVGYTVEFFDLTGRTVAVVTLPGSRLRRTNGRRSAERPKSRLRLILQPTPNPAPLVQIDQLVYERADMAVAGTMGDGM